MAGRGRPRKTDKEKEQDKDKSINKAVKKTQLEVAKCTCRRCGRTLKKDNFYVSYSPLNIAYGRMGICKECVTNTLVELIEKFKDIKEAFFKLCMKLDMPYVDVIYLASIEETGWDTKSNLVSNGLEIWKKYIKSINSLAQYKGYTFDEGEQFISSGQAVDANKIRITKKEEKINKDELQQRVRDKQNREDIIRIVGYDVFANELEQDKSKMYAKLVNMLDGEEDSIDESKLSAIISIIKGQNQENKVNDTLTSLCSSTQDLIANANQIKQLTDIKEKLTKQNLALAKDNKISELYSGVKKEGSNSLSGIIKKLKSINLDEAQVNLFDINTSNGMQQVAEMSAKAIVNNLNFGDDDLTDMVKHQRQKLEYYQKEYSKVAEENRKLKILCNTNNVDYKEDLIINEVEFKEELSFGEEDIAKLQREKDELENKVENTQCISTLEYIEQEQQKREEEEMKELMKEEKKKLNEEIKHHNELVEVNNGKMV